MLRKEISRLLSKEMWMLLMDVLYFNYRINRLRKEINRLLRKGMSSIYLKATIEKN